MPFGDEEWKKRNPHKFQLPFSKEDQFCECGQKIVDKGMFYGFQDHPWHQPKIFCDCGKVHQLPGLKIKS